METKLKLSDSKKVRCMIISILGFPDKNLTESLLSRRVKDIMGISSESPNGSQQIVQKETRDETTPLLPVKVEEEGFHEFNGASFSGAVFNLSTTIVGAGIMALPASIKMLGIIPGILMIIVVALLTEASIDMLVRCSHQGKITSYGWLMGEAYGQWGRIALQASVVINNIGVMIVYMIIIGIPSMLCCYI